MAVKSAKLVAAESKLKDAKKAETVACAAKGKAEKAHNKSREAVLKAQSAVDKLSS